MANDLVARMTGQADHIDDPWNNVRPTALAACEADRLEQARLNGMGSEREAGLLDPEMPAQELRLHLGEMTAQEVRTARAAIAWANAAIRSLPDKEGPK